MFVQTFKFIVMKMHKKLLQLELLLLAQIYAPNRLSAGALPQTHWGSAYIAPPDHLAGLGVGPTGNGKEGGRGKGGWGREGRRGEDVPECPNPELASLSIHISQTFVQLGYTCIKF